MNEIAMHFLQTYAAGGEVDEGWKYAKALRQSRLDYTEDSLARLDHLLKQVRERAQPTRADLDAVKGRNFVSLIAYYAGEMLRRRTGADLVWHDGASARRLLPAGAPLPDEPVARLLLDAPDQCVAFWPLGWVEDQLLPGGRRATSREFLDDLVTQIERDGPSTWWQAAEAMGRMASRQMRAVAQGAGVLPMMSSPGASTAWRSLVLDVGADAGIERALEHGARRLELNPDHAAWQVLGYDGVLADEAERLDAVIVLAHTYGARPLRLKVAFPYRPPRDGQPFVMLQAVLRESNVPVEKVALLEAALQRGLRGTA